jgi:hypothetical protein
MHSWARRIDRTRYLILIIVAIGVATRVVSIPVFANTPYSPVDVYYVDNQAAQMILDLKNPYTQGLVVHNYVLNQFPYLPMIAVYYAPFYLLGDIRFGNIFADILIMFSVYWIAKSINRGAAFFAPLTYALLPFSIWLTSVAVTNIMIGASFLTLSTAALLKKKYLVAAIFLGLALTTNQLVSLALPLLIFYFWGKRKFSYFLGSLLLSVGIILPFLITDPFRFIYDVVLFQFERPPQIDGPFSLFSIVYFATGVALASWIRVALFLVIVLIAVILLRRKTLVLLPLIGGLILLGAFILPVNGFWNYFLPGATFICALIPYAIDQITVRIEKSASST